MCSRQINWFSPASILFILDGIVDLLQADTARKIPIPPLIQVLLLFRFVATVSLNDLLETA